MSYGIYLSFNNQMEGFQIPVNPETIDISGSGNSKTYDLIGRGGGTEETRAGEVNVIKNPKLREVSFSSFFPAAIYPFIQADIVFEPMHYIRLIEKWMATRHPIRFIYTGRHSDPMLVDSQGRKELNFPASIEKFDWKEAAGSPGEIEYSLTLKEYVFYSARKLEIITAVDGSQATVSAAPKRPDERIRAQFYRLKKNETIVDVSMKFFADAVGKPDSTRYREIQRINELSDNQVKQLKEGDMLKIPPY
ncbi:LysM peptidoglycan-binding domain-containing protein [Paenibacillus sp. HWE-109]|uniref:LysM peptidoglycan-binding domain-containing protein n=1 Tax=Paenibacillus sp. HWE-109 TaxID=1306526 RepID=UPI001EDED6B4|nr:LysM peptidoglycan-binding domain-containing protein [Paenibacillus sp. HWE-109]UKS24315.1 LysM peptidoglycan-binding domain-containing protein [Paenibacillus sp. HWE-109]